MLSPLKDSASLRHTLRRHTPGPLLSSRRIKELPAVWHICVRRPGILHSRCSSGLSLLVTRHCKCWCLTQTATQVLRSTNRATLLPTSPAQRRAPSLSPRSLSCSPASVQRLPLNIRAGWSQGEKKTAGAGALSMKAGGEEMLSGASAVDGALQADFPRAQVSRPPLNSLPNGATPNP